MDITLLREWAPFDDIVNKIPSRWHRGMFASDICLTCIDVVPEFVALGTNAGFAIWYDRQRGELKKLLCEEPVHNITEIKVVSSVEYMVACGADNGLINVFSIPKEIPIGLVKAESITNPPERYCIRDLHTACISSLEWSKNGMKLFSGDKNGCVVLTEIDFYMHICKSMEVLNESYEIVQLCFKHPKLIISTLFRTIITEKQDSKWEVSQIGKQDRKCLSKLGATFLPNSNLRESNRIYNCRHGYRLWVANHDGSVEKTLLFRDKIRKPCFNVPILNPKPRTGKDCIALQPDLPDFGIIIPFGEYLLTYNQKVMYLLDPEGPQVLAVLKQFRDILSASTSNLEIFILEGPRNIIRISTAPDKYIINSDGNISSLMTSSSILSTLNSKLKIISGIGKHLQNNIVESESENIVKAEECIELPPIEKLALDEVTPLELIHNDIGSSYALQTKKIRVFEQINDLSYDENILYKSEIRKKQKGVDKSMQQSENYSSDIAISSVNEMEKSTCSDNLKHYDYKDIITPDLRSPTSILEDIKTKERKLAELLNLEKITVIQNESDIMNTKFSDDFKKVLQLPDIPVDESKVLPDGGKHNETTISYEIETANINDTHINHNEIDNLDSILSDGKLNEEKVEKDITIPTVKDIPGGWNLENVKIWKNNNVNLLVEFETDKSLDNIDSDWEIL